MKLKICIAIEKAILRRAIKVALIVGVLLNIINQGDLILHQQFSKINFFKILLTFAVPYLVSTYSSVMARLNFITGEVAQFEADIKCKCCKSPMHVEKGEIIGSCHKTGKRTKWKLIKKY